MVDCDGAYDSNIKQVRFGVVIRDDNGKLLKGSDGVFLLN